MTLAAQSEHTPSAADRRPLRVAVDARPLATGHGGISRTLSQLLPALARREDVRMVLLSHRPLPAEYLPPGVDWVVDGAWRRLPGTLWLVHRFARLAERGGADVLWGTQNLLPPDTRRLPAVLTVHDMVHRRFPETMRPWSRAVTRRYSDRSIRQADVVVAVSSFTRDEILHCATGIDPGRVCVIPHGRTDLGRPALPVRALPAEYLFCLGSLEPRKNLVRLVDTWRMLQSRRPQLHLVLAGSLQWQAAALSAAIGDDTTCAARIHVLAGLSDAEVQHCLARSQGLVMPSLYEGFGMPVVEASGIAPRLFLNDIPVLREVGRHLLDVSYIRFDNPEQAARELDDGLARPETIGPPRGDSLRFRSWPDAAADYVHAFQRAVASG